MKTIKQVRNELLLNYASLFEREDNMFRLALLLDRGLDLAREFFTGGDMATSKVFWGDRVFTVEYRPEISAGLRNWQGDFWDIRYEGGINGWSYRAILDHTHGKRTDPIEASIQIQLHNREL